MPEYEQARILIWGKTYPELSTRHIETVCTAGVFDDGRPVRIYPIDYRYLDGQAKFKKYQWIDARVARNPADARPESYKIDARSITPGNRIPSTSDEWGARAAVVFSDPSWQFDSAEDLFAAQIATGRSLGVVVPRSIEAIEIHHRPEEEARDFADKLERLRARADQDRAQLTFFEEMTPPEVRHLDFVADRIRVLWHCYGAQCNGHRTQILDWEAVELHRREGEAKALAKVQEILDLETYAVKFFLGNIHRHPRAFTIVGIWYPKLPREPRLF